MSNIPFLSIAIFLMAILSFVLDIKILSQSSLLFCFQLLIHLNHVIKGSTGHRYLAKVCLELEQCKYVDWLRVSQD